MLRRRAARGPSGDESPGAAHRRGYRSSPPFAPCPQPTQVRDCKGNKCPWEPFRSIGAAHPWRRVRVRGKRGGGRDRRGLGPQHVRADRQPRRGRSPSSSSSKPPSGPTATSHSPPAGCGAPGRARRRRSATTSRDPRAADRRDVRRSRGAVTRCDCTPLRARRDGTVRPPPPPASSHRTTERVRPRARSDRHRARSAAHDPLGLLALRERERDGERRSHQARFAGKRRRRRDRRRRRPPRPRKAASGRSRRPR